MRELLLAFMLVVGLGQAFDAGAVPCSMIPRNSTSASSVVGISCSGSDHLEHLREVGSHTHLLL